MTTDRAKAQSPKSLSGLLPFLRPYRGRMALALLFLVLAAVATLLFPLALRSMIDGGLVSSAMAGNLSDADNVIGVRPLLRTKQTSAQVPCVDHEGPT